MSRIKREFLVLLVVLTIFMHNISPQSVTVAAWKLPSTSTSRRRFIGRSSIIAVSNAWAWLQFPPKDDVASAAQGAAELDFNFYMRDLFGGNKKEGNIEPSEPPPMKPPRTIKEPLLSLLIDDELTKSCVPIQALIELLISKSPSAQKTNFNMDEISLLEKNIRDRIEDYRNKSSRSFSARAQWNEEKLKDQYYFDLTSYALWRAAADLIPNYVDRDQFARNVGQLLYKNCQRNGLLREYTTTPTNLQLEQSEIPMLQILQLLKDSQFCTGYKIRTSDSDRDQGGVVDTSLKEKVFDEFDDEALQIGGSVDVLVSIYEPATLGASLQITGEQSRFMPDFVASTLAAMWGSFGIKSSWETFFVDAEYRPNPKDYFPNEKLIQFTLSKP